MAGKEKAVGLFQTFCEMTSEAKEKAMLPNYEKKAKGRIKAAHTDCEGKIIEAELALQTLKFAVKDLNINAILEQQNKIEILKTQLNAIAALYVEEFGVSIE